MKDEFFQNHMHENICFGCGIHNEKGLKIKSRWEGEVSLCQWVPEKQYQGWPNLLNGGIMATLIDCHCMCTAMAAAYREEDRKLDSEPFYRYATGTLEVKYLKPTPANKLVLIKAKVLEIKGKKVTMESWIESDGIITAEAKVIAIRVFDSSQEENLAAFRA